MSRAIIAAEHGAQHECNRILPGAGGPEFGAALFPAEDMVTLFYGAAGLSIFIGGRETKKTPEEKPTFAAL